MTGPQDPDPEVPAAASSADGDEEAVIAAIHTALAELDAARERPVAEHVRRFEAVHNALTDALSTADTYLSGTSDRS
ncbi:hypothetical protein GCM10027174_43080 [Salinifilum aidingensis]